MSGGSLAQRSPTECGVSVCDRETSIMRRPTRGLLRNEQKWTNKNVQLINLSIRKRSHIRKNTSVSFFNLPLTP